MYSLRALNHLVLSVFLLSLAVGVGVGAEAAEQGIDIEQVQAAYADPVKQVDEFDGERGNASVMDTIDEHGALVLVSLNESDSDRMETFAQESSLYSIQIAFGFGYFSAPWGYAYPALSRPAVGMLIMLWAVQMIYQFHPRFGN